MGAPKGNQNVSHNRETAHLLIRIGVENKALIKAAAKAKGQTMRAFVESVLVKASRDAVQKAKL